MLTDTNISNNYVITNITAQLLMASLPAITPPTNIANQHKLYKVNTNIIDISEIYINTCYKFTLYNLILNFEHYS